MKNFFLFVVLATALFTISSLAESSPRDNKVSKEIASINKKFADSFTAGDASGMVSCYADDASFLPPNSQTYTGTADIKKVFENFLSMGKIDFTSKTLTLIIRKDIAVDKGTYTLDLTPKGKETMKDKGKYIIIWKQLKDGSWKILYDMYSSDLGN